MLSGGSSASVSLMPFASTVTVQMAPSGRLEVGIERNGRAGRAA